MTSELLIDMFSKNITHNDGCPYAMCPSDKDGHAVHCKECMESTYHEVVAQVHHELRDTIYV